MSLKPEEPSRQVRELDLAVPTMVCDGCAEKIRAALSVLPGMREVKVGLWRKRVRVRYEQARLQEGDIRQAIVAAGFPVQQATGAG